MTRAGGYGTGKLTCLASHKIIHCIEDTRGRVHVRCGHVRHGHVWEQLDAITQSGSTGRSALVSSSLSEALSGVPT